MHDNARPHTARSTVRVLVQGPVRVIGWPAWSPDMNPIEHMWDVLERRIRAHQPRPHNLLELRQALLREWNAISIREVNWLIGSVRRRVRALHQARGGHTRY